MEKAGVEKAGVEKAGVETVGVMRAGALAKADRNANRRHPSHYLTTVGVQWVCVNQRQPHPRTRVGVRWASVSYGGL